MENIAKSQVDRAPASARQEAPATKTTPSLLGLRSLIVPLLLLLLWQVVTVLGVFDRSQLPGPLDVLSTFWYMASTGRLNPHIAASLIRVFSGFFIGGVIAIAIGLAVGLSRPIEALLAPTLAAIRAIPSLAWVPLLILWMGVDDAPKVTLVAIGAFFPVYTNLVAGIRQIDRKLVEVGYTYGLRGFALARDVMLPAALPSLLSGLRIGLAQSWLFLVAAELIAASAGLGFLLIDSQNSGRADIIVMSILLLAILGKTTDSLLQLLEHRLLRWNDTFTGRA